MTPETPKKLAPTPWRRVAPWILALAAGALLSCGDKSKTDAPINPPSLPGNASPIDIGTKVGNGRVISVAGVDISTSMKWTRNYPLDANRFVIAGDVGGDAAALISTDRAMTWKAYATKADGILTWSVGTDGTLVLASAKRMKEVPKGLPPGQKPPIDSLSFMFAAPGQPKITTASPLIPTGDGKVYTVPLGDGMPAVLGPGIASVVLELGPKSYAVAFGGLPGESPPAPLALPKDEVPVNAPFGHPPQLLTSNGKQMLIRPWPAPTDRLAEPKILDKITLTKTLLEELSAGPECEWGPWSYRRVMQPTNKVFVLAVSPDKTAFFELPPTTNAAFPLACSADRVVFEYLDQEKQPKVAACPLFEKCTEPNNRPFLKQWPEQHDRELHMAATSTGIVAVQQMRTKVKWALILANSRDGGKLFGLPRPVGEGEGNAEDGYDMGAMIGLGERSLILLSARVSKTTRRSWYAMASDDGGETWVLP